MAEESTPKAATTTENALVITAIVAVALYLPMRLCRPIVLSRRGAHLCACSEARACLRILRRRVLFVRHGWAVASRGMGRTWIVMGTEWGVSRGDV